MADESVTQLHIHPSADQTVWSVGGKYILKHNPKAEQLERSVELTNLLATQGIPLAAYIKTTNGDWLTPCRAYCLMEKLPGKHVDFYDDPQVIYEMGRALARLHAAFVKIEPQLQYKDRDFLVNWRNYIKPGLSGESAEIAEQIEPNLFKLYEKLPRQPIHRDAHAQNVLFKDGKISGWLDFDLNCRDARIFDLAYLLTGLLVGKINDLSAIAAWRALYRDLLAGYNEISKLSDEEIGALPILMIGIELLFVTFWGKNNNEDQQEKAAMLAKWLYNNEIRI